MIRYVNNEDKEFWFSLDKHLAVSEFYKKVRDKQGYILEADGSPKAVLRYNLFWDNTPFCTMLVVEEHSRSLGLGKQLMEYWEADMKAQGYGMVMVSTQSDEEAQHFYRKLGYRDCGGFTIDVPGYAQPMEIILIKGLNDINI